MNSTTLIVAVLTCLNAIHGLNLIKRDQSCDRYMQTCAAPLIRYGNVLDKNNFATELENDTLVDELCSNLSFFTNCISNGESECAEENEGFLTLLNGAVDILQFMCTPEGRTLLREMAQSPCAGDENLMETLEAEFQACVETFQFEVTMVMIDALENNEANPLSQICPLVNNFRSCSVEGTRALCGDAFATFVARLWDAFSSAVMSQQGINCNINIRTPRVYQRTNYLSNTSDPYGVFKNITTYLAYLNGHGLFRKILTKQEFELYTSTTLPKEMMRRALGIMKRHA